jgi:hypothetical protein
MFRLHKNLSPKSLPYTAVYATTKYATTNKCYNELSYNERMLQRTVFINEIRMLQRTQMLQQTILQRTNAQTNSFYQENQDAKTNAGEYYWPT